MLEELKEKINFLKEIPPELYYTINTHELLLPNDELNKIRIELEQKINCNVMTYKLKGKSSGKQLCQIIKTAKLTLEQLNTLKEYESKTKILGASLCAYKKPISFQQNKCQTQA